ncbi:MAG: hypothetical protein LQ348_007429 [Seirophora lacunosa]|nr:MAG: hypothetical protein LQ348_007429 [Seirophora lacunosa]
MVSFWLVVLTASNWAGIVHAQCFAQNPPDRPQASPTIYKDCFEVIRNMVGHDKTLAPTLFSRKPGLGFKLPHVWVYRSCLLRLDMHSDDDEDSVPFFKIAVEAGIINAACVVHPPHLGGTLPVGPLQVMNISLYGLKRRGILSHPINWKALPFEVA